MVVFMSTLEFFFGFNYDCLLIKFRENVTLVNLRNISYFLFFVHLGQSCVVLQS